MQVVTQKGNMKQETETHKAGSSPAIRTTFTEENEGSENSRTVFAQNSVESGNCKVKFPQTIRHRKADAPIYG